MKQPPGEEADEKNVAEIVRKRSQWEVPFTVKVRPLNPKARKS